jgi:hypothetical protein
VFIERAHSPAVIRRAPYNCRCEIVRTQDKRRKSQGKSHLVSLSPCLTATTMENTSRATDTQFQPRLHHASAIRADPILASTITAFVNEGYRYFSPRHGSGWDPFPVDRLPTAESIHEVIGEDGIFSVMYDPNDNGTPIACAAAKSWTKDHEGGVVAGEDGWEILTVTAHVDWMGRGLPGRCVDALVKSLVWQARNDDKRDNSRKLSIWIQAIEDLYGAYWKKMGWVEVRAYTKPAGEWGSKVGYRLLVLLQEYEVN